MIKDIHSDNAMEFSNSSSRRVNLQQDLSVEQQQPPPGSDGNAATNRKTVRGHSKRLSRSFLNIPPNKRPSSIVNLENKETTNMLNKPSNDAQGDDSNRIADEKKVNNLDSVLEVYEKKVIGSQLTKNKMKAFQGNKIEEILKFLRVRQSGVNLYQKELATILTLTSQLQCFSFMYDHPNSKQYRLPLKCVQLMKYECFQPGQTIFKKGDEPDRFYLLLKGSVNLFDLKPRQIIENEKSWLKYLERKPDKQQQGSKGILSNILKIGAKSNQKQQQTKELRLDVAAQLHFEFLNQKNKETKDQTDNYQSQNVKRSLFKAGFDDDTSDESASRDLKLDTNKSADSNNLRGTEKSNEGSESEKEEKTTEKTSELDETTPMFVKMLGGIDIKTTEDIKQHFEDDVFTLLYEKTLSAGTLFGELGLLSQKPRSRTLISKEFSELVSFGREGYYALTSVISEKKVIENFEFIRKSLFPEITMKSHLRLLTTMKLKKFRRGQPIYQVGDSGDTIFLIREGEVALEREIQHDLADPRIFNEKDLFPDLKKQGTHRTYRRAFKKSTKENLSYVTTGQYFGEEDIFLKQNRTMNAVCHSAKAKIYAINGSQLLSFAREFPGAISQLKAKMQQKNSWRSEQIEKVETTKDLIKSQVNNSSINQMNSSSDQVETKVEKTKRFSSAQNKEPGRTEPKGASTSNSPEKKNFVKSEKTLRLVKEGGFGLQAALRAKKADRDPKTWGLLKPTDKDHIQKVIKSNEKILKQKLNLSDESSFFDPQGFPLVTAFATKALQRRIISHRKQQNPQEKSDQSTSLSKMSDSQIVEYYMNKKNIQKTPHKFFATELLDKVDDHPQEEQVRPTKKLIDKLKGIGNASYLALNRKLKERPSTITSRNSVERIIVVSPFSSREISPKNSHSLVAKSNLISKKVELTSNKPLKSYLSREIKRRPLSMKSNLNRSVSAAKASKPQLNNFQKPQVVIPESRRDLVVYPFSLKKKTPVRVSSQSHQSMNTSTQ